MVTSLRTIKNSLSKSLTAFVTAGSELTPASAVALGVISLSAAVTAGSVIMIASVVALGVIKPNNESVYKMARNASLLGTGGGALLGLVYVGKASGQSKQTSGDKPSQHDGSAGQDWRNFVVVRKVKESEEITSFYLQPEDQGEILNFQPGQFLTIKLDIPGQAKPTIRTYSLSDYNEPREYYRLSIKREPMPEGLDVPAGLVSNFMHDQVQEGFVIPVKPPSGKFVLDLQKPLPAVLISNGVGITPLISMAKAASQPNCDRPIWFVHGARDGRFHAFRDEALAIDEQNPNLHLHFTYSRPQTEDAGHHHSTGHVDTELIRSLITQEAEYFLCGSPPFMESIRAGLKNAGVPESRVFFESFIKAIKPTPERLSTESSNGREGAEVVFNQSGKTITWESDADSILDFAEANDLNPPYSCREGICGTCECRLLEGEVEYQESPTAEVESGSVLICISKPKTAKVVLDL